MDPEKRLVLDNVKLVNNEKMCGKLSKPLWQEHEQVKSLGENRRREDVGDERFCNYSL